MVNVNLESIKKYFPPLKRFIARLREEEVNLLSEKNEIDVNANEVLEGFSRIWQIVAFGENINKYNIEISIENIEAIDKWLGVQRLKDTDILLNKLNMIDSLDIMDNALYQLYKILDDKLLELEEV